MGQREEKIIRRKARIKVKIRGTSARPRLTVFRSLKFLSCQIIDDSTGRTLLAVSDRSFAKKEKGLKGQEKAKILGAQLARAAQDKGIKQVVFDRAGSRYHGRLRILAEAAREAGLQF